MNKFCRTCKIVISMDEKICSYTMNFQEFVFERCTLPFNEKECIFCFAIWRWSVFFNTFFADIGIPHIEIL